jgi:hypothetical protein
LATQPQGFIFGNFEYPRLRLLDATDVRAQETIVWWRKLRFLFKEIIRESWCVFLVALLVAISPAWGWLRRRVGGDITCAVILLVLPFTLLGCFTPSRYQYQHYFVFIPLLVYASVVGIRAHSGRAQSGLCALATIAALILGVRSWKDYAGIQLLNQPDERFDMKAAVIGQRSVLK